MDYEHRGPDKNASGECFEVLKEYISGAVGGFIFKWTFYMVYTLVALVFWHVLLLGLDGTIASGERLSCLGVAFVLEVFLVWPMGPRWPAR